MTGATRRAALGFGFGLALALAPFADAQASETGVTINNRMFSPDAVRVSVGDTVTWTNASRYDLNLWIGHVLVGAAYLPS